jgi:hypothetical protein
VTGCVAAMCRDGRTDGVARGVGQTVCHVCLLQAASTKSSGCYQTVSAANKAAIAAVCSKLHTEQHLYC